SSRAALPNTFGRARPRAVPTDPRKCPLSGSVAQRRERLGKRTTASTLERWCFWALALGSTRIAVDSLPASFRASLAGWCFGAVWFLALPATLVFALLRWSDAAGSSGGQLLEIV